MVFANYTTTSRCKQSDHCRCPLHRRRVHLGWGWSHVCHAPSNLYQDVITLISHDNIMHWQLAITASYCNCYMHSYTCGFWLENRAVGSKFNLFRPSVYDGRNCDQMAAQAATGGGWKPLQPAILKVVTCPINCVTTLYRKIVKNRFRPWPTALENKGTNTLTGVKFCWL